MGEKTLHSHADGKKHKKRLEDHEQVKISLSQKMQQTLPKNPSKTSESVVIATPVDSVSVIGSTYLIHPILNLLMPVFLTELAKRL